MKMDLVLLAIIDFFFERKKMASNFDQETFEFILKDNKVNEEKFDIFHKEFLMECLTNPYF